MSTIASHALYGARILVDELLRGGLRRVCIAPGSRSTPLVLAIAERAGLETRVLTDERSMGFFALGMARASGEAVAVVCTSGTAAANLLPAVAEASLGGGALLLLTADRPPEDRDCAAPQTIDQAGLFGSHVRFHADLPLLAPSVAAARVLRSHAARALATARSGRGGAVQINVPMREPFHDDSSAADAVSAGSREDGRAFTVVAGQGCLSASEAREIAAHLSRFERGVLVCAGRELPAAPIARLASALGWPLVSDCLSGLRFSPRGRDSIVDAAEPLLRDESFRREWRPDCILRFGLTPASRSLQRWLDESFPAEHILVAEEGWPDPVRAASLVVRSDAAAFCEALLPELTASSKPNPWLQQWRAASEAARARLESELAQEQTLFDGIALRAVAETLPEGATLVVGNSMPIRDADAFLAAASKPLRVLANRGANGIDGLVSTALGAAAVSEGPTALVVGDLSFLHDAAAITTAAREGIALVVVVVNNDGGGIFSYLPLHDALTRPEAGETAAQVFERFFATPHGSDLERFAALCASFRRVRERGELDAALRDAIGSSRAGVALVEVQTDREAGKVAQQALVASAQAAAREALAKLAAGGSDTTTDRKSA